MECRNGSAGIDKICPPLCVPQEFQKATSVDIKTFPYSGCMPVSHILKGSLWESPLHDEPCDREMAEVLPFLDT